MSRRGFEQHDLHFLGPFLNGTARRSAGRERANDPRGSGTLAANPEILSVSFSAAWQRTSRLLEELERLAVEHGDRVVQLETNALLVEAIALYRSAGYVEVAAFNDEPFADHWFRKDLQVAEGPE